MVVTSYQIPVERLNDPSKENCIKWLQSLPIGTPLRQAVYGEWCKFNKRVVTSEDVGELSATRSHLGKRHEF